MDKFTYVKWNLLLDIQFNFNAHMPYINKATQNATPLYIIAISLESTTFMNVDVKYNPIPTILDTPITAKSTHSNRISQFFSNVYIIYDTNHDIYDKCTISRTSYAKLTYKYYI